MPLVVVPRVLDPTLICACTHSGASNPAEKQNAAAPARQTRAIRLVILADRILHLTLDRP
jgi:hypothetical protein